MTKRTYHLGALVLAASLTTLGTTVGARPLPADADTATEISRGELGRLDLFLDSHPDIAKALVANPALATNQEFLSSHPAWKAFLEDHPEIRAGLQANPTTFMNDEEKLTAAQSGRIGRPESISAQQKEFAAFLNQHPAIAKQLVANPTLIERKGYGHRLEEDSALRAEGVQAGDASVTRRGGTCRLDRNGDVVRKRP